MCFQEDGLLVCTPSGGGLRYPSEGKRQECPLATQANAYLPTTELSALRLRIK